MVKTYPAASTPEPEKHARPEYLYLATAALCLDCDRLFEIRNTACPSCASRTYIALGRLLPPAGKRP